MVVSRSAQFRRNWRQRRLIVRVVVNCHEGHIVYRRDFAILDRQNVMARSGVSLNQYRTYMRRLIDRIDRDGDLALRTG